MKYRVLLSLFMALSGGFSINAQVPNSTPQTNPRRVTPGGRSNTVIVRDANNTFDQLRSLEIERKKEEPINNNPLNELRRQIYRKPDKDEIRILAPSALLLDKYSAFLRQPYTGIIKLNGDSSCAENPQVVDAKGTCLQYPIPGAGTAYSFRFGSYRLPRLADLMLSNGVLKTDGVLQQGIMVNLGDVKLTDVTLQTKGLKYLIDFKPAADFESLQTNNLELSRGIKTDGFLYRLGFYANDRAAFALRSIAYKGKYIRSVNGMSYNELEFDKRKDIIVAFQIVETQANGNITILWKILLENNAPTLKIKSQK